MIDSIETFVEYCNNIIEITKTSCSIRRTINDSTNRKDCMLSFYKSTNFQQID